MFLIPLSLPFLSARIFVYSCLYQNKDHQYLLKDSSWCHHALENVMNFANSLSTACLHSFVLPSLTEIVLQCRDPFHCVFSPSAVLDKTKWWTKSGQPLSYTHLASVCQSKQDCSPKSNHFHVLFCWKVGFSSCSKTYKDLEYFRGPVAEDTGIKSSPSWPGYQESQGSQQEFPR